MELLVEIETESSTFGNGYDRPIPSQLNYSSMEYTIEYLMSEAKNEKKKRRWQQKQTKQPPASLQLFAAAKSM